MTELEVIEVGLEALKKPGFLTIRVGSKGVALIFSDGTKVIVQFGKPKLVKMQFGPWGVVNFKRLWTAVKVDDSTYKIKIELPQEAKNL